MKRKSVAAATGVALVAGLLGATPASAAYSVSARASNTGPDAGQTITISGRVLGGSATRKVALQYLDAGNRWVTSAVDTTVPGGSYAVTTRRTRLGTAKYRTVAVAGNGAHLGRSVTLTIGWFTWQPLVAATQYVNQVRVGRDGVAHGSYTYYADNVHHDTTASFGGRSYPRSWRYLDQNVSADENPTDLRVLTYVHRGCTDLRFSSGMDSQSDSRYGGRVRMFLDGAQKTDAQFVLGDAPADRAVSVRGGSEIAFYMTLATSYDGSAHGIVDVGDPLVRCKVDITGMQR